MLSPNTNWRPISRIARDTAARIIGSPIRLIAPFSAPVRPGLRSSSTFPVSKRAQVEALTSDEADCPRWRPQFDGAILSSISASMVTASGTRSNASARHIRAMPSSVDRPYSARNTSIRPGVDVARMRATRSAPWALIAARSAADRAAVAVNVASTGASGA